MSFEHMMNAYNKNGLRDSAVQRPTFPHLIGLRRVMLSGEAEDQPKTVPPYAVSDVIPRLKAPPMSGTVHHWQPPTSLFSTLGLQAISGLPHTPIGGQRLPRGQLATTPVHQRAASRTTTPLPSAMNQRPPPGTLDRSRAVTTGPSRDPIMGTLSSAVSDARDWLTTSQSCHSVLKMEETRAFGKATTRNYRVDGSVEPEKAWYD